MIMAVIFVIDFVCLVLFIRAIYTSPRRIASFGYAAAAFALIIALGMAAVFTLVPSQGSVIEVNSALYRIGSAITIAAPLAAVWAAYIPSRQAKL